MVKGTCPDRILNMCFVILKESRESLYEDCRRSQRKNGATEEAKTPSPLFTKGLLHWISPRGWKSPLSRQIHLPSAPSTCTVENGGLQTHLQHFLTHCISVWFILCFLTISIELWFPVSLPLSGSKPLHLCLRRCPGTSLPCCCQVSALTLTELFVQPAGLEHTHSGCTLDMKGSLHSRLGIMHPHSHN